MPTDSAKHEGIPAAEWVRATTIGWFLGFLFLLAIILVADLIGFNGQTVIAVGIGAGVGFWQSRLLGDRIAPRRRWVVATVVGLAAPFLMWDLSGLTGVRIAPSVGLPASVIVGGLLVSLWQWRLLRPLSDRASSWIVASALGWTLPALAVRLGDLEAMPGAVAVSLGLIGMFLGGTILGAVTARPLARITATSPGGG